MNYKIAIPLLITALSISACKSDNTQTLVPEDIIKKEVSNNSASLEWVAAASAIEDANKALSQQDTRLWGYHDRGGAHIIGVAHGEVARILQQHQLRSSPGISDVVYGDKHEALRKQFFDYAKQYNQVILDQQ